MRKLRIFRRQARCQVLGPGTRAVIWVQGCSFACPGCLVPESWDFGGGEQVSVEELSDWVLRQPDLEGVTFSGGEPFAQADALVELVDRLRTSADFGFMSYTGYRRSWLQRHGSLAQKELLLRLDLLVDGRYRQDLHDDLLWRGSRNQALHILSDRYHGRLPVEDKGQGLELEFGPSGSFTFSGVPDTPNYAHLVKMGLMSG